MADLIQIIHNSWPVKVIGLAIIVWAFYTLIMHPDRVLIDSIMHKKKEEYNNKKTCQKENEADNASKRNDSE